MRVAVCLRVWVHMLIYLLTLRPAVAIVVAHGHAVSVPFAITAIDLHDDSGGGGCVVGLSLMLLK